MQPRNPYTVVQHTRIGQCGRYRHDGIVVGGTERSPRCELTEPVNRLLARHSARSRRQLSELVQQLVQPNNRLLLATVPHALTGPVHEVEGRPESLRPVARGSNTIPQRLYCTGDLPPQLLSTFRDRGRRGTLDQIPVAHIDAHLISF